MPAKELRQAEITELLRELLERHDLEIHSTDDPMVQLATIMRAINIEWRRLHGPDNVPVPRILVLRVELIKLDSFDVHVDDEGRARRIRVKRSSLYTS